MLIESEFSPRSDRTCSAITSVGRICRWRIASILHRRNSIIMFAVAGQPFLANEAELVENRTQSGAYPQPQLLFRIRRKGCQPGVLYPAADREMVEVLEFTAFEAEEFVHRVIKIATDTCAT